MINDDPKMHKYIDLPDYVLEDADEAFKKMILALNPIIDELSFTIGLNSLAYVFGHYVKLYFHEKDEEDVKLDSKRMIFILKKSIEHFSGKKLFGDEK